MVAYLLSRLVVLIFGTLYPAYYSYKAVKTRNVKEYVKWMMYWIVFALFSCVETVADIFASILPFYYEVKILFIFWLISPWTKGSTYLYRKCIHPTLSKKEQEIDEYITQASTRGYEALKRVGRNGMTLAANAVMTSAIKGQSSLLDQLKVYSGIAAIAAGSAGLDDQGDQGDQGDEGDGMMRKQSLASQISHEEAGVERITKLRSAPRDTDEMDSHLTPELHDLDYGESTHGDLMHSLDRLDNRLREEREQEGGLYIEGSEWDHKDIGHHYSQPDNDEWGDAKGLDYILDDHYNQGQVPQPKPRAKPRSPSRKKASGQAAMTTSLRQPHPPTDQDSESSDVERPPTLRRSTSLRSSSTSLSGRYSSNENLATSRGRYTSNENLTTSRGRYASTESLTHRQMARRQEAKTRQSTRQSARRNAGTRRTSDQLS